MNKKPLEISVVGLSCRIDVLSILDISIDGCRDVGIFFVHCHISASVYKNASIKFVFLHIYILHLLVMCKGQGVLTLWLQNKRVYVALYIYNLEINTMSYYIVRVFYLFCQFKYF